jgi:hypothetical protein
MPAMSRTRIGLNGPALLAGSIERFAADLPGRWIDQLVIAGDLTHRADRIAALAGTGA